MKVTLKPGLDGGYYLEDCNTDLHGGKFTSIANAQTYAAKHNFVVTLGLLVQRELGE